MEMTTKTVLLCGVGGQGTILAAEKVESPMTATTGRCSVPARASSKPWAMETEAPMSTVVSMAASGGRAPRV